MIDVLVPVLSRPANAQPLVESFRAHSSALDEIIFICSPGDSKQIAACMETGERVVITNWEPGPGDYARKMNYGYRVTERPWIFLGADDIRFTEGWWKATDTEADVIATNDLANKQVQRGEFGTHCFVRRSYVDEQGASADGPAVLLHEGYDHNYVDRELCGVARARGSYLFSKHTEIPHRHPHWRTASWDDTYRKGLKNFHADRDLFITRAHMWGYMGLSSSERNLARRRYRDIVRAK